MLNNSSPATHPPELKLDPTPPPLSPSSSTLQYATRSPTDPVRWGHRRRKCDAIQGLSRLLNYDIDAETRQKLQIYRDFLHELIKTILFIFSVRPEINRQWNMEDQKRRRKIKQKNANIAMCEVSFVSNEYHGKLKSRIFYTKLCCSLIHVEWPSGKN